MSATPRLWLAALAALLGLLLAGPAPAQDGPLSPPDTSSPRATLQSFLHNFHEATRRWYHGETAALADVPLGRALSTLDLSGVPEANRAERSVELAFQLQGILQRIELPPEDQVPDAAAVAADGITSWRIPDTELVISRQADGPMADRFLFSQETVTRLPLFFARVHDLPVLPSEMAIPGAYDAFRLGPGPGMPALLADWFKRLPPSAYRLVLDEPLWKWLALLAVLLLALPAVALLSWLGLRLDRRLAEAPPLLQLGQPLAALATLLLTLWLNYLSGQPLRLTGQALIGATVATEFAFFAAAAWLVFVVTNRAGAAIVHAQNRRPRSIDAQLIRLSFRLLGIFGILYIAVHAADKLGAPVGPLLAGIGVTGLAIALAVRPTMENVIAGFMLFADRPVRIGEFCQFGDKMGTVEEIGLRSTRIRGLDRTVITVPNADFSQMQIVNFTRRDQMLFNPTIALGYDTTTDQLRYILARIREMLIRHPRVLNDPARIRFAGYSAAALNLEVFAFVGSTDYAEFLGIREDLNLRIKEIVESSGARFALPIQRVRWSRDEEPDDTRIREIHAEVENWRKDMRLPFPDFAEHERHALADTLPFPPEGSTAYRRQDAAG
ncbi:mechanosensitive ion channel family protein [Geminicoccus harenae]|uniref:mechanosensitive ion channel family protein n=1 Tax=Geminicoccus harenae TaxID=2498453 RepID=UPI00168A4486|nr:mechanosensitive ion channel family protein [Geminicoccus harenae]